MSECKTPFWAVIPAAGIGQRFGSKIPKQYLPLQARTVIEHALQCFLEHPRFQKIVVALAAHDTWFEQLPVAKHPKIQTVIGGNDRAASVLSALSALDTLADPDDWVAVHDAARPCLLTTDLNRLVEAMTNEPVGGLLAAPLADSIKSVKNERVVHNLPRADIWRALTPQVFQYARLKQALISAKAAGQTITDEASAIETLNLQPKLIAGDPSNIKVTWNADLIIAEALLNQQSVKGAT